MNSKKVFYKKLLPISLVESNLSSLGQIKIFVIRMQVPDGGGAPFSRPPKTSAERTPDKFSITMSWCRQRGKKQSPFR